MPHCIREVNLEATFDIDATHEDMKKAIQKLIKGFGRNHKLDIKVGRKPQDLQVNLNIMIKNKDVVL